MNLYNKIELMKKNKIIQIFYIKSLKKNKKNF